MGNVMAHAGFLQLLKNIFQQILDADSIAHTENPTLEVALFSVHVCLEIKPTGLLETVLDKPSQVVAAGLQRKGWGAAVVCVSV